MKKILFVCMGNTCRSPMAEMILKEKLKKRNLEYDVSSCGIAAYEGSPLAPLAREVLIENGVPVSEFKSRAISEEILESSDYIFCMTKSQTEILKRYNHVYFIGDFISGTEITDPYELNKSAYELTYKLLDEACERIINYLES